MAFLRRKSLVRTNLELWMNDLFLRDGLYKNVSTGELNIYGTDISKMVPVDDEDFAAGQVFQSAFKNWVYEEGIPAPSSGVLPPTVASGVTVNSTFFPSATTSGAFAHFIDYPNGRVVFQTAILVSDIVQGEFAFKEVTVDFADKFDNERLDLLIETSLKDNPQQTGVAVYPTKENRTLPAVWIDIRSRDNEGYELGSKSLIADLFGVLHIWGRDSFLPDIIEDILTDAQRDVILGIDFNTAPFPLLSRGRKNPDWPGYKTFANVNSPFLWHRIYLDTMESEKQPSLFEVERIGVRFQARVYPNF